MTSRQPQAGGRHYEDEWGRNKKKIKEVMTHRYEPTPRSRLTPVFAKREY